MQIAQDAVQSQTQAELWAVGDNDVRMIFAFKLLSAIYILALPFYSYTVRI